MKLIRVNRNEVKERRISRKWKGIQAEKLNYKLAQRESRFIHLEAEKCVAW